MERLIDADVITDRIINELRHALFGQSGVFDDMTGRQAANLIGKWIDEQPTIQLDAPRVMTLDEVIAHYSLPPVFVDDFGAQEDYYEDIRPLYFEFPYQDEDPWIVHWRGHAQVARYLNEWRYSYNKKWRCWTDIPTAEQMEATKWDG